MPDKLSAVLGDKYCVKLNVVPSDAVETIENVDFLVSRSGFPEKVFASGSGLTQALFMARNPGNHTFKAEVQVRNPANGATRTIIGESSMIVKHEFPNYQVVESRFREEMDNLWEISKSAATSSGTYEFASLMYIDTTGDNVNWDFETRQSQLYPYSQTEFPAVFPEDKSVDYGDPRTGGKWVVGIYHTHPGWAFAPHDRVVGRSTGDTDTPIGIPAWVMDYEPDLIKGTIRAITPYGARTAFGKLEHYGGQRRNN